MIGLSPKEIGVTVVVPALNEGDHIEKLLESLESDFLEEILVVDGGSTDDTIELAEKHGATVIEEEGPDKCPANAINQGVREASTEIVCLLLADTYVEPDFIEKSIGYFENEKVMAVNNETELLKETFFERIHNKNLTLKEREFGQKVYSGREAMPPAYGFWRRKHFLEIGGHPKVGWREIMIFRKKAREYMEKKGLKTKYSEATQFVHLQQSWEEFFKTFKWYGRTLVDYLREGDPSFRNLLGVFHQPIIFISLILLPLVFLHLVFVVVTLPFFLALALALYGVLKERDYEYLLTIGIDIAGGLGILYGLFERLWNKSLSRG